MSEALLKLGGEYVTVQFDYQPAELGDLEYPGCAESAEINEVFLDGIDIFDDLSVSCIDRMETECLQREE